MSEQKDDATALSKEENDDLYVMNWERNLGGYAFQVIIGLTFAVVCGLWYTIEVVRSDFFSMEVGNSLWFPLCFELIANPIMAVLAAVILMGFFRRKSWVPNVLSRYFKVYGILMLIDFVWVLLVLETIVPNAVSEFNGCEVGRPFGCFFWAWYFRRLFSKSAK